MKILPGDAAVKIVVSVTQDPTEYLGVVQIQRKENTEMVMGALGPLNGPAAPEPAFRLTLHREFLFSQDSPILDVLLPSGGKHAEALGAQQILSYDWQGNEWVKTGSEHLPINQPPARGERGFLFQDVDSQSAYFSHELCRDSSLDAKGWSCETYADQTPVRGISPAAMAGKRMVPWFSAAQVETEGKPEVVVTGQDGQARLYEDGPEPTATFSNWGTEIASVYSGCGSGWQLLVTGKGDWTKPDEIQAVDIQDRRAQTVSDPMAFPGPVVVLHTPWTRITPNAAANGEAVAVDRNLQTGRYEAYLLTISCSR
ncbi:MAG: hypothetical protein WCE61_07840 [Candidatus Acidiferrum sp.]